MRIIRPYGQSIRGSDDVGPAPHRLIRLREALRADGTGPAERDIAGFAASYNALVIVQWISAIDKIATKPRGNKRPTQAQRDLRNALGGAAWALIVNEKLLPGLAGDTDGYLEKLWRAKIAPYPEGVAKPEFRNGKPKAEPRPEGRWYARFAGGREPGDIDAEEVARCIYEHLHLAEYRIVEASTNKRAGRIQARAGSIAANVLKREAKTSTRDTWSADERKAYENKVGNIALAIRGAAIAREEGKDGAPTRRVGPDVAAKELFDAWKALFGEPAPTFAEARERSGALVDLHEAIRDWYRHALKHHGKDQRTHGQRRRKVSATLPETMAALFARVDGRLDNRELAALVRLGKIIHYEAATRGGAASGPGDAPAHVLDNWPRDIAASRFWTSDGQTEIKRNEAFVRIWRHGLTLAARTLRDWVNPDVKGDILLSKGIADATGQKFDPDLHQRKLRVLLGARAGLFLDGKDEGFQKATLRLALHGTAQLRHNAFHFNGLGGFATALKQSKIAPDPAVLAAVRRLWEEDLKGRAARLKETMRGARLDHFFDATKNEKLLAAVAQAMNAAAPSDPPLPRFRRLLQRAANIRDHGDIKLRLPKPAGRAEFEQKPAQLAQYVGLKLIYEHPFRRWLDDLQATEAKQFIDAAVARAEQEAKEIFGRKDEDRRAVITAKAGKLRRPGAGEKIQSFLFRLSAETASEMRVQRGYEHDAENAREQAGYIEDLRCDVLAQAFDRYLEKESLLFLTSIASDDPVPHQPLCNLAALPEAEVKVAAEDWQVLVYFILHLMPVDDVARLLHQIRKWDLLAGKAAGRTDGSGDADVGRLVKALSLYLDMHDAKFESGQALALLAPLATLFDANATFARVFAKTEAPDADERLPLRGLREIMRFGHLPPLETIFRAYPVTGKDVDAVMAAETGIAEEQAMRQELHEKWAKDGRKLSGEDCCAYVEALATVTRHRHAAAHVRLVNHVRLHRLMMAVLGRLVDFSGLWERDLYFTILALAYRRGRAARDVFTDEGIEMLSAGRIIEAWRNIADTEIKVGIEAIFGPPRGDLIGLRNNFAHFNMLQTAAAAKTPPDLTAEVNKARKLMAHDRKLKNAVAQAAIELLAREGLELTWDMQAESSKAGSGAGGHTLTNARLTSRQALHLGKLRLYEHKQRGGRARYHLLSENLHGDRFVMMVAALLAGTGEAKADVRKIPLDRIDWSGVGGRRLQGGKKKKAGPRATNLAAT